MFSHEVNVSQCRRVVVTGGPGAGKTTLLDALAKRGFRIVPETARAIIQRRLSQGLTPRPAPAQFASEILATDIQRYRDTATHAGTVFFDRSLLDGLGMLNALGQLSGAALSRYISEFPYHPDVFVLPPWQEIYRTDSERDQTYAEAVRVHDSLRRWYERCGYRIVTVPRASVDERCAFVDAVVHEDR